MKTLEKMHLNPIEKACVCLGTIAVAAVGVTAVAMVFYSVAKLILTIVMP